MSNLITLLDRGWEVLEDEMFSDHRCLHTKLNKAKAVKCKFLNLKKTDWAAFTKELDSLDWRAGGTRNCVKCDVISIP